MGQHAENRLNAELRKAGSRFLTASAPSSVPLCQHSQHLLRYLGVTTVLLYINVKKKTPKRNLFCVIPHLLLLRFCAAQQHVEQDMRKKVDCDLVVMLDDETTAGEHSARQLVSNLKHTLRLRLHRQ